uniref:Si:ch73-359m17.11 n=1 Tax=Paramormyrops kingsleyae TaxID=1676925 RepID=A0A3B3T8E4_9TELE
MSATPADLEKTGNLPVTPRLILLPSDTQGQWMKQWMISLEGRIICEDLLE